MYQNHSGTIANDSNRGVASTNDLAGGTSSFAVRRGGTYTQNENGTRAGVTKNMQTSLALRTFVLALHTAYRKKIDCHLKTNVL